MSQETPPVYVSAPQREVQVGIVTTSRRVSRKSLGALKDYFVTSARAAHRITLKGSVDEGKEAQRKTQGMITIKYRMGPMHLFRGRLSFSGLVKTETQQGTSIPNQSSLSDFEHQQAAQDALGAIFDCSNCPARKPHPSAVWGFQCPTLNAANIHVGIPHSGGVRVRGSLAVEKQFAVGADTFACLCNRSQMPAMVTLTETNE